MRDTQRRKFYDFERAMVKRYLPSGLQDGLELRDSRTLVERICRSYNVNPPTVTQGRSDSMKAYYSLPDHKIVLPPWAQRDYIVVHETAHAIVYSKNIEDPGHGKGFVRIWMDLWSRMYDIPLADLEYQAGLHGLSYEPNRILA